MRRYVTPKVSDNSGRGKVIDTCIARISNPSSLDANVYNGSEPEPVRGSKYSLPHAHDGSSSETSCSRLCCQTGTPHSCAIVKRLQVHFDFMGLYTCLYSTGVGSTLRAIFQVKDSTPLTVIGRGRPIRLYRSCVIRVSHVLHLRNPRGVNEVIVTLVVHTVSSTGNN